MNAVLDEKQVTIRIRHGLQRPAIRVATGTITGHIRNTYKNEMGLPTESVVTLGGQVVLDTTRVGPEHQGLELEFPRTTHCLG